MYRILALIVLLLTYACSPVSPGKLNKLFTASENKFQNHTGFILYDPEQKKELYQYHADKYFTPASNTKIFTLYASLKIIGDSIPGLRYIESHDSLIFWGTGDPSFLYKNVFNNNRIFNFLNRHQQHLYFSGANFKASHFGKGWAWDDYNDYYSAEKYALPIYGNIVSIDRREHSISVLPKYFKNYFVMSDTKEKALVKREPASNKITYYPGKESKKEKWDIPFKVDSLLVSRLLRDTLKKHVTYLGKPILPQAKTLFSIPADSLYKVMMQQSDNLVAEQLVLICSGLLSDTLSTEIAINYVKNSYFQDLKDKPVWIDGSGLSRYNLCTPRTITQVWEKLYREIPRDRLFNLLAVGGKTGTLKNSYKTETPYIFGKTGTLSNNHNLSGFLISKKGKVLIFSFMNNNYVTSTEQVKRNMENVLVLLRDNY